MHLIQYLVNGVLIILGQVKGIAAEGHLQTDGRRGCFCRQKKGQTESE